MNQIIKELKLIINNNLYQKNKITFEVFKLTNEGLLLTEIAPGIDLDKDILAHMEFAVKVSDNLKLMDARIFKDEKMNLKI